MFKISVSCLEKNWNIFECYRKYENTYGVDDNEIFGIRYDARLATEY